MFNLMQALAADGIDSKGTVFVQGGKIAVDSIPADREPESAAALLESKGEKLLRVAASVTWSDKGTPRNGVSVVTHVTGFRAADYVRASNGIETPTETPVRKGKSKSKSKESNGTEEGNPPTSIGAPSPQANGATVS